MAKKDFPYSPFRDDLYTAHELLGGFDPGDPHSYAETLDFKVYHHFVQGGRDAPRTYFSSVTGSLHDNSITQAMRELLVSNPRVVGIMGAHQLARGSRSYVDIVKMARQLAREGYLVTTGGGPGAMEAAHLGVFCASADQSEVDEAIRRLSAQPSLPANLKDIVSNDGAVNEDLVRAMHAWYLPAFELTRNARRSAQSLAVATWHYGHEPPAMFASHIAKYFQNSVREEGLLAIAKHGIIYTEGRGGTLQELFQDAAQNYYRTFGWFSPMVLLGVKYWTATLPVVSILRALFGDADFGKHLLVTDSTDEAMRFILDFAPPPS